MVIPVVRKPVFKIEKTKPVTLNPTLKEPLQAGSMETLAATHLFCHKFSLYSRAVFFFIQSSLFVLDFFYAH